MSTRSYTSKTVLQVGTISPVWDAFDVYQRDIDGGNSPVINGRRRLTENNYVGTTTFRRSSPCKVGSNPAGPFSWSIGTDNLGGMPVPEDDIDFPSPYDMLDDLRSKWRQSEFQAGVALGEGKESLDMMVQRISGIGRAAAALKKGNLGGALKNLFGQVPRGSRRSAQRRLDTGDISGAFLELNLGWSPMISDVYALSDTLSFVPLSRNRIRTSAINKSRMRASGLASAWRVDGQQIKRTTLIAECWREPTIPERLGLTDPVGIIWELVPYSFIVDYFLPIGNSLANATALGELPLKRVIVIRYENTWGRSTVVANPVAGLYHDNGNNMGQGIYRSWVHTRSINDSIFDVIGSLGWLPSGTVPKLDLNLRQLSVVTALAHQRLRSIM